MTPEELETAVRDLFGERWAGTGVLDEVLVVAVQDGDEADAARLHELVPGAGVVAVPLSRQALEQRMDAVQAQLESTDELAVFLAMRADGFTGTVEVAVEGPVPLLRAWAERELGPDVLVVVEEPPAGRAGA